MVDQQPCFGVFNKYAHPGSNTGPLKGQNYFPDDDDDSSDVRTVVAASRAINSNVRGQTHESTG